MGGLFRLFEDALKTLASRLISRGMYEVKADAHTRHMDRESS